ncbi:hypothetical protein ABW19_dt0202807 [Dactylella cylindrospora]|nr:hypothetical protein ABW19_dt0202807 [Dactylella cylindrospora]
MAKEPVFIFQDREPDIREEPESEEETDQADPQVTAEPPETFLEPKTKLHEATENKFLRLTPEEPGLIETCGYNSGYECDIEEGDSDELDPDLVWYHTP